MQSIESWNSLVSLPANKCLYYRHRISLNENSSNNRRLGFSGKNLAHKHQSWFSIEKGLALRVAKLTTANSDVSQSNYSMEPKRLAIYDVDPDLLAHTDHLNFRWEQYLRIKRNIEKNEGSLLDFSLGYKKFGFNRERHSIIYREWAPAAVAAQLVGDFNNWDGSQHNMVRDQFGVWSVRLPHRDGHPVIPHRCRVKVRLKRNDGSWVFRVPAWIKWAAAEPGKFGATYDGIYWDPPASERFIFKYPKPPKPVAPRIYEAHVGMSATEPRVASYIEFADNVLPRIKANNYNTVQLMAIMEHNYYASFGYHVTNFFAVSSRSGTPEDLKYLIDKAHSLGLRVLIDVVHSHASNNPTDGINGFDFGQNTELSYFHTGDRGYHKLWDSRLFNYGNWEVQRFLLSNLRWWLDEYRFDGFRFDGVTSMLYHHHGTNMSFSGSYTEYFDFDTDVDAVVYLMLANDLIHSISPSATVIAEDVSGMPTVSRPLLEGGVGFDYRLSMATPDKWIQYLKDIPEEEWKITEMVCDTLLNRRFTEKYVAYAESHDQSLVGDKTIAFRLMDSEMYTGMTTTLPATPIIKRGIAMHKMIHFATMALGGDGYLNFMGNEFGHPEWVDFPRDGNDWKFDKCRRQWNLVDAPDLRYKFMNNFNKAMNGLDEKFKFLSVSHVGLSYIDDEERMVVFDRGGLVFVFNFHATETYTRFKVGCDLPGKYRIALDSDAPEYGGEGRLGHADHFATPEEVPGKPETDLNKRPNSFMVLSPPRTCQVYFRVSSSMSS